MRENINEIHWLIEWMIEYDRERERKVANFVNNYKDCKWWKWKYFWRTLLTTIIIIIIEEKTQKYIYINEK
jgi:hypothetical protein